MLPWKEVGELSKNDCTFRGSAAEVLAMVGRDSMVIYVLRYDGSYTRGTKR